MSLDSEIIIVSGLPRSGTSLMMQMLQRGGIPALTDECRRADDDNPRGYFEFERVKRTKQDPSWLQEARGKVVKMVSALLYDLPLSETYRVIFMRRSLDEILESQETMLQRRQCRAVPREQMKISYGIHLERLFLWLPTQPCFQVLECSYNDLLKDPLPYVERVVNFLDGRPSPALMLDSIDPALYRNRQPI